MNCPAASPHAVYLRKEKLSEAGGWSQYGVGTCWGVVWRPAYCWLQEDPKKLREDDWGHMGHLLVTYIMAEL